MKVGFNLLVIGSVLGDEHLPLFERMRQIGYDGVEVSVFEGPLAHYERLGRQLKDLGLEFDLRGARP